MITLLSFPADSPGATTERVMNEIGYYIIKQIGMKFRLKLEEKSRKLNFYRKKPIDTHFLFPQLY